MPRVGQRMYVVRWDENGEPRLVGGRVIPAGRKASPSRVRLEKDLGSVSTKEASETIRGALTAELLSLAKSAAGNLVGVVFSGCLKPWAMARAVAKLVRLRRKLERHGLWP